MRAYLFGAVAIFACAVVLVAPHARATTFGSDTLLPHWQGTSTSAAAAGHEIDCTSTNANWPNCTIDISTIVSGANCYDELVSTPLSGITGTNLFTNTPCTVNIGGTAQPLESPGTSDCTYLVFANVSWRSGAFASVFNGSGYPVSASLGEVRATTSYHLATIAAPGSGGVQPQQLSMNENFIANFNSTQCPGDARQQGGVLVGNVKANVYDPVVDTNLSGSAGYLEDSAISP